MDASAQGAKSFFWHDYETFGVNPRRDRPAQFAGLRTDLELNEIEPLAQLYCQPPDDSLPQPQACLLTRITPQLCLEQGEPEYRFAQLVHDHLARPGTIGVGYNTIRFDDEVTRFLLWRNLLDPYAREWQNGCGRWDLIDVVRATWALRPEGMVWPSYSVRTAPRAEDVGMPAFRLELLSQANGLVHEAAHDAASDVRATIALAKLIKARQPRLWDFCLRLRKRQAVLDEMGVNRPFLHLSGMYGVQRGGCAIVWPLAAHPNNKNEVIVWDLRADPAILLQLDAAQLRERMFGTVESLQATYGADVTRLPIKTIHLNKCPIVVSRLSVLPAARAAEFAIDVRQCLRHAETAAAISGRISAVWKDVYARPAEDAMPDVDESLYSGFLGNSDRRRLDALRALTPQLLAEAVHGQHFADTRLPELLFRYRARNFPHTLNEAERVRWAAHCHARLYGESSTGLTLRAFTSQMDALQAQLTDAAACAIASDLRQWAQGLAAAASTRGGQSAS